MVNNVYSDSFQRVLYQKPLRGLVRTSAGQWERGSNQLLIIG